ncbi:MAG: oligopeptidase B [Hyphomicrobiaceae bacterium]|jgi:oligopeptidase B
MTTSPHSAPPRARKQPTSFTRHGVTIHDEYAWLRAENWQQVMREPETLDADIRDYLDAENTFLKETLADTNDLQATLFEEMKARIKEDDSSVPSPDGPWSYYSSFITGGQYPRFCRCPRDGQSGGADEMILLDGNKESDGHDYWQLGGLSHSPDHNLMAYAVDTAGSEYYTLRIRDLATGKDLPDVIESTGGMVWAKDSQTIYYIRLDDNHRPLYVHRHRLGTPAADDELIYQEQDTAFYVHLDETQSGDYLLIDISDHETSEVHLIDATDPKAKPRLIEPRTTGLEYSVDHNGDTLYILTNADDDAGDSPGPAVDFRICVAPVAAPQRANWIGLIPHKPGTLILHHTLLKDYMIRLERTNSLPQIIVRQLSDGAEHSIAFDEEAYSLGMGAGYEFDTTTVRFSYSSMTTPSQTYDYDLSSRDRTLRKTQEIPSGHDPADYITRRLYATASDGAQVPISLIHHRDTALDGTAPLLLYGYGSYGIAMPAGFSTTRLSLVNRGFVYAIAHIRGGKDKGYAWYTDGKRHAKRNTFTDFIAAGEHLANEKFTTRGQIIGHGGSAGGMLMGAVANMAPDLFNGIIANVPFVDVLNTILDDTLPLTPPEWAEWGNPITSPEDFELIRSYSPYDNVTAQDYPHLLALGGLTDPRVTYWEPAKWVARLREHNTSDNLLLLKTNMSAGHGGASGRFDSLKEVALEYAFALRIAGKT